MQNSILDYQRGILAEMGIPLWVDHNTPVQTIDLTQFEGQALAEQADTNPPFSQETPVNPAVILTTTQDKSANSSVFPSDFTDLAQPAKADLSQVENLLPSPIIDPMEKAADITYSLACMRVNHWVLLADNQHLASHPAEQQLWQTMAHNMNAEQTMLNFPIVKSHPSQPATHQMRDITSAQMTFIGFIHAAWVKAQTLNVGALSPLPEMIEDIALTVINIASIQRLPYLSEMLADPRQKRQLWELIKN